MPARRRASRNVKAGLDFVHKTSAILKVLQINAGTELGTRASPAVF